MKVSMIAAVARNGVIGVDNRLPWHLPADLRHFRRLTMGHVLIMGRKTFEAAGPLDGRRILVLSRRPRELPQGVELVRSLDEGLRVAQEEGEEEVFVAGGAEVYRLALPHADTIYLTRVEADFEGDTCFPELDPQRWQVRERRDCGPDERNPWPYSFLTLERVRPPRSGA